MRADYVGNRGQWLFCRLVTELCGNEEPYFRPEFLGDRYPTFDYVVHLVGKEQFFFLAQVKTTHKGYVKARPKRLRVRLSQQKIDLMVASPIPAYFFGIDDPGEAGYILSINEKRRAFSSLSTRHPLKGENLKKLWQEVNEFWSSRDMVLKESFFVE